MSKGKLWGIILLILFVLGFGIWLYTSSDVKKDVEMCIRDSQRSVQHGPLVLVSEPRKFHTPTIDSCLLYTSTLLHTSQLASKI